MDDNIRGDGPIRMVRPKRLLDPLEFQKALEGFEAGAASDSVDALVGSWNKELARAANMIAPKRPSRPTSKAAPWYTEELRGLKQLGRQLERRWRRTQLESDRMQHRTHLRAYTEAVRAAKKTFWSVCIASTGSHLAELSQVGRCLISTPSVSNQFSEVLCCDALSGFFADKIPCIWANLNSTFSAGSTEEVSSNPSCSVRLDQFQSVIPEDVDKLLQAVQPTSCSLDPCPNWLLRSSREIIRGGLQIEAGQHLSVMSRRLPSSLPALTFYNSKPYKVLPLILLV
ncbi:ornithine transcarbamylase, mitochondrial isoform X2 [Hemicordylus capensis]|uniref:ornithine transcarbamylase, mitochondrial isoform X2 n=1 Tax=Hemicordylus capensis TaxID=884348 RepID=UPI0023045FB1|nr:ornithine transcarbamylase, mitochondrial isoform X2 [Hemicordylus capensis]